MSRKNVREVRRRVEVKLDAIRRQKCSITGFLDEICEQVVIFMVLDSLVAKETVVLGC